MDNKVSKYFKEEEITQFGLFSKINRKDFKNKKAKLILVTSINPTPAGEGKTTTLIGINDSLNQFNKSSIACLRQPSMGPFFGIKGGATGSGECEIQHPNKINCGFTGDFYEIEAANNLISAIIENEIYFNSELQIDKNKIFWKRCIDVNDRSLRDITYNISKDNSTNTFFTITAASNLMALFCLAKSKQDFKHRLENTIVALNTSNEPIYVKDLNIIDSIMMILDDALNPNLAFSKYNNPIIIHGGPFANIAHGCNSIIATSLAMGEYDYVLTEAGFGADLGAEKFLNIKCREMNVVPSLVVIAVTLKAVKHHGGTELTGNQLIMKGFENVVKHIQNIKSFNLNYCIIINKFSDDDPTELEFLKTLCDAQCDCEISNMWSQGPQTSENIHNMIIENCKTNTSINYTYDLHDDNVLKIEKICKAIYGAKNVNFNPSALKKLQDNQKYIKDYYVCCAKTPYSFSADQNLLGCPKDFDIDVNDIEINHAAKFIIPILSKIFLMPGLPKEPNAKRIKYE